MTERDNQRLKDRQQELKTFIKSQESKPKDERNTAEIAKAKLFIANIDRWLNGEPAMEPVPIEVKKKIDGPPRYNKPEGVMTINTVEELEKVFHQVKKRSIMINCPPDVQEALKAMIKEFHKHEMSIRFIAEPGANVHFTGIDKHNDPWNAWYRVPSRKPGKVEKFILKKIGQDSFDDWKRHKIHVVHRRHG